MPATLDGSSASFELNAGQAGNGTLILTGRLDARSIAGMWKELEARFRQTPMSTLEVNAAGVGYCDGAGLALLHALSFGGLAGPEVRVTVQGLRPELLKLFETFAAEDYRENRPQPPEHSSVTEEVGRVALDAVSGLKEELSFIGEVTTGLAANMRRAKALRWGEIWRVFEVAGVNALPIISLISLLVGLIIAFEAAGPFEMFGAQIYIANMLGIIMARELAGLMAAIILAGRSGSAFAAELGTMKVNEELNALETMGLSPVRFLVVQRILAGILLTPLLTIYAIFVSIAGGVVVMMFMGFSLVTIYNQMAQSLHLTDILIGVVKGVIFGALIAGIGCLRGLQTKKGPSAVGESTTSSVVTAILMIIVADAVVAVLLYLLHL
jgi:phospholipid/cholesterol/gamma-HCH transport system permease protein